MDFFQNYQSIDEREERQQLRNKILIACEVQFTTFYSWLKRKKIPLKHQPKISKVLNIPVEILFPKKIKEN